MVILVISNPFSGAGTSHKFVQENVLPLLQNENLDYQLEETKEAGAAAHLAFDFLQKQEPGTEVTIVVSGGDGTVHEVVNGIGLSEPPHHSSSVPYVVRLVICPQGTANALYSTLFPGSSDQVSSTEYRLRSLHACLEGVSRPLVLTRTQLLDSDSRVVQTILGVVVTSTALHAAILESAEHLRASTPGIERFKLAAAHNISTWYHSRVLLHPPKPDGTVRIFDPQLEVFNPLDSSKNSRVDLPGPYAYFISTVNVDRLEPNFEISPLFVRRPPGPGEMDLVVIRPLRDPSVKNETPESRANFVKKASIVLQAAYNHGTHITLSHGQDGIASSDGGPFVVEYIRCGGWEWNPDEPDAAAHIVCVDGTILRIGKGGKAICQVIHSTKNARFTVCA